jgi:peroxiredoxin
MRGYQTALTGLLLALTCEFGAGAAQPVRAVIQAEAQRKSAPAFGLEDGSRKTVRLADYRGRIVLLDFWATECGGCVQEIPSFIEIERKYKPGGLVTLGVSVDVMYENLKDSTEAWAKVRPFMATQRLNYPIVMGDDAITKLYDIQSLPLTLLIDKRGRIAATYSGIVDRNDLEANIRTLLGER